MNDKEIKNSIKYWNEVYTAFNKDQIKYDNWLDNFNDIIVKCNTPILDLGCGRGNNVLTLLNKSKEVIPCDISENAIKNVKRIFPEIKEAKCFNMIDGLPFDDNSFEIIIADLSLHYFREKDTKNIIFELKRVLKINGYLIVRVNSINNLNHGAGQGEEIEYHLYKTKEGILKRFFDEADVRRFFMDFEIKYIKEELMTRHKLPKLHWCICMQLKNK
ncbi:MAG TPA: class I SAM-dependent methyltransferase [Clostridiales bacterium]|nr:class I SAM-dependent methyltransferase [Clostridiales bacterium]